MKTTEGFLVKEGLLKLVFFFKLDLPAKAFGDGPAEITFLKLSWEVNPSFNYVILKLVSDASTPKNSPILANFMLLKLLEFFAV